MTRRLIAILLLIGFPLQGWAALAMPVCMHVADVAEGQALADGLPHAGAWSGEATGPCHQAADSAAHSSSGADSAQCDQCPACHLAHPPMLTPLPLALPGTPPAQRAERAAAFYYQLFPDQLQRPPLRLA